MDTLSSAASTSEWPAALAARGVDLAAFGAAYLFVLANVVVAAAAYAAARRYLIVSPNNAARDYGLYVSVVLTVLLVATILENELSLARPAALEYAAVPHLVALLALHVAVYRRVEPWLVTLAACATAGALAAAAVAAIARGGLAAPHSLAALSQGGLLAFLWRRSISTKRAYARAKSIYVDSKERPADVPAAQASRPGLGHAVTLAAASFALTVLNSMLRGNALEQVPAVQVAVDALLLLGVTVGVCAIPAALYWVARRGLMPELTRFVWLVWLVVGFTFTYGNFLTRLDGA